MEYCSHEQIANVVFVTLKLAEDELQVYEAGINFVLENCPESQLISVTGCEDKNNLIGFQEDLVYLLKKITDKSLLPKRFDAYDPPCYIKGL